MRNGHESLTKLGNMEEFFDEIVDFDAETQKTEILKKLPTARGVLYFADGEGKPIQILTAANIRRMVEARLFTPEGISKRAKIADIVRKIHFSKCYNNFATTLKYYEISRAIYPDSYNELLKLPRCAYIKIDMGAKWPSFRVSSKAVSSAGTKTYGLFPT